MMHNHISIVVPFYNERENLVVFYERLARSLNSLEGTAEIIFVDDGSTDGSFQVIKELHQKDLRVKLISLSRNFGQQNAITAGLAHTRGEAVVIMDADLQDPPELIPELVEKLREGYDVVYAIREKRKEGIIRRICYRSYYRLLNLISTVPLPVDTGDFCIMDRKIVELLNSLPERNRYIRGLRSWLGWAQTGIPYERERRYRGKTKYTLGKLSRLAMDGIISFSRFPFEALFFIGGAVLMVTVLAFICCLILALFKVSVNPITWIVMLILFVSGVQFITLGLLGEMAGHISDEVKRRPYYIIREKLGFKES